MATAEVLTMHRWIARAQTHFEPDFSLRLTSDLRYAAIEMYRDVAILAAPDELLGARLADHLPAELVYQIAAAAQRAICLDTMVEIRYPLRIGGRLVMSRGRIRADRDTRMFVLDILRIAAVAVLAS